MPSAADKLPISEAGRATPSPATAVIIPYYQREAGILRKAVASVLAQRGAGRVHIIIVDDESPIPAVDEVASFPAKEAGGTSIEILRQRNGGPGSARNLGLDNVDASIEFIAFLDSDDTWSQDHLARAIEALNAGYDFYFSNYSRLDATVDEFARLAFTRRGHELVPGLRNTFAYVGDLCSDIISACPVGTPTVVYRRAAMPRLRFDEALRLAGEDQFFYLDASQHTARFVFSSECEVQCGRGINIFQSTGWGTPGRLRSLCSVLKFRRKVLKAFPLSPQQRKLLTAKLGEVRRDIVLTTAHDLGRGRIKSMPWLLNALHLDWCVAASVARYAFRLPPFAEPASEPSEKRH